ncbi:MAG: protein arginine kinase [Planctomycetota bacterium]
MRLEDLIQHPGEWLRGEGEESDIVISTRVRLARNVAEYPFLSAISEERARELGEYLSGAIEGAKLPEKLSVLQLSKLSVVDRQVLVERHLISREHAEGKGERSVAVDDDEVISVMVNEEDHLRIQVLRSGLDLDGAYDRVRRVDEALSAEVNYAFDGKLGYLTACPTNVGTGMRVSVMVHLPVLVLTKHIRRVHKAVAKIALTVRGFYGEGTEATGDLFQISNQVTLGKTEEEVLKEVDAVVRRVASYERQAREQLMKDNQMFLEDRVGRAYHALLGARTISSVETMQHLSAVRTGIHMGIVRNVTVPCVNELFVLTQPGHLQKIAGEELDPRRRDAFRSAFIRKRLESSN